MEFSNQWFARDIEPTWREHLLPRADRISTYLEIGVCEGASFFWACENLVKGPGPGGRMAIAVDPFQAPRRRMQPAYDEHKRRWLANRDEFAHNLAKIGLETVWLDKPSSVVLAASLATSRFDRRTVDLAYVDGDHRASVALLDMVLTWECLIVGGIMVVDDIDRRWFRNRPQVREAIDAFAIAFETRFEILYRTARQIAYKKNW